MGFLLKGSWGVLMVVQFMITTPASMRDGTVCASCPFFLPCFDDVDAKTVPVYFFPYMDLRFRGSPELTVALMAFVGPML